MIAEVAAATRALKTVYDFSRAAQKAADDVEKNQALLDMQGAVLDLQSKMLAMQEKMGELAEEKSQAEAKLIELKKWEAEASEYQLTDAGRGRLVMALKPEHAGSAAPHWLCPNCFEKKEKSYLNPHTAGMVDEFKCIRCGYSVITDDPPKRRYNVIRN